MPDRPQGANLRTGLVSFPGMCYFVTTDTDARRWRIPFPDGADLIIDCWRWLRDHRRIWVGGYVVMDDHVHVLMMLREGFTLARVLDSFKTYTATRINRILARKGAFWQEGYYDHAIRDEPDFWTRLNYTHNNPVRRGWVERPEDYAYSTAHPLRANDIDWSEFGYSS